MIKDKVVRLLEKAIGQKVELERPVKPEFGDYSTNVALKTKTDPKEIIKEIGQNSLFEKVETVNGFINFFLSPKALQNELKEINSHYGDLKIGRGKKIQVEFISANPTGPLTVGNARGGPLGDVLANVLAKAGYEVEREYYLNDCGAQIEALGHSVLKDEEAKYQGKYIDELNKKNKEKDPRKAGQWAAEEIIKNYLKKTAEKLGVKFDSWFRESEHHQSGLADKVLKILKEKDLLYEQDGAVWFKAKRLGDNRDRVVVKSDDVKTYLAGDIAHHYYKFEEKKFDKVVNIWGADHHGDVAGLQAGVAALGHRGKLDIILTQFVTLIKDGAVKKISKRAGDYTTLDELINEVGKDAVRFFFLQKSSDTHLNFDLELAKEQSKKNPVFYVQYGFARLCNILAKAETGGENYELLIHPSELNLIRRLIQYPEIIKETANDYQVQRLPHYSLELANGFHRFYEDCRVLDADEKLKEARIGLIKAAQIILKDVLTLMGVEAPEKM